MLGSADHIKLWEEAICPVCLEHPHNAVLLRCSSFDKGCRPFMCNTSARHSNCLDQFRKSSVPSPSRLILPGIFSDRTDVPYDGLLDMLTCPLCRGQLYGWFVIEPAREFMNSKTRTCSNENCEFFGNYTELREHARSNHPDVRPSVVDPERLQDWTRLESEITLESFLDSFPFMNLFDDLEAEDPFVIPSMNSAFDEGVMILDAIRPITPNIDSRNIGFVTETNGEMIDDVFCLDSLFFNNIGIDPPSNVELLNFFDTGRMPPNPNSNGSHLTHNSTIWNHNNYEFSGRAGDSLISRQNRYRERVPGNNRNQDYFRRNNRRQDNSFQGNYTHRMRESRVNRTATYHNSRNGSDRRGNRNSTRNV